jgi:uncharacterized RDD family membrane protein YckC
VVDRKDIGSWLSGPDTSGISKYPGERLGLPESGPGSIARAGRRIAAIMIDWGIALLISNFAFGGNSWATRALGIAVVRPGGGVPGPLAALVRAVLLCLVVPAVIFDPDQRGLHDKAMNTLLIRR